MALGASAGLGVALLFGLLVFVGTGGPQGRAVLSALAPFLGQLSAGYVAGRFARHAALLHGSYAALALHLATTTISLVAGAQPGLPSLFFFTLVAGVLGAAGGLLVNALSASPS
ncbi:MAG: hypothetical protein M3N51_01330 [Actinomycetota bacterium]|nr:hypothetical protein [Actinomycetota bacterium]